MGVEYPRHNDRQKDDAVHLLRDQRRRIERGLPHRRRHRPDGRSTIQSPPILTTVTGTRPIMDSTLHIRAGKLDGMYHIILSQTSTLLFCPA